MVFAFCTFRVFYKTRSLFCSDVRIMNVLNVAEKNDAAKNIAGLLSGGDLKRREGKSKFNKIYEFSYNLNGHRCKMITTSVSGHLLTYEFVGHYKKWNLCSPEDLFSAPVSKTCPQDFQQIRQTLELEIRKCDMLIIWTDCDREGENIGFEVIEVCTQIKPNIRIYRAKFSEITKQSVKRAAENLEQPNNLINEAVNVRSELDLRIGASFTRFQTLRLQKVFPDLLAQKLISYGSCQFPTLGFVVERYKAIQNFVPENFWKIKVGHKINNVNVEFVWKRGRLFDQLFCQVIFERCLENKTAKVENVQTKPKSKWRPLPLDTVELEKSASRKLKINAKQTMQIAERLYSQGYISYPRTETNTFPQEINLNALVQLQAGDNRWGNFANKVLQEGSNPRQGTKSDQAHPPIHPTKCASNLQGNEAKVYEYIVRHFLACVSKNAEGLETTVNITINDEKFVAHGLRVLALNYLEVYPYDKWTDKEIHEYNQGQTFEPTTLDMVDGITTAPNLLTEADLIALMEKHGIGTDATHAEHIETIKSRLYVGLEDGRYFVPGELGIGLVEGYDTMGFEMSKPYLRAELEADLKAICEGRRNPQVVLSEQIEKYRHVFRAAVQQANKLDTALTKYFGEEALPVSNSIVDNPVRHPVMKCRNCNSDMILRTRENATSYVTCGRFPDCRRAIWFPQLVLDVKVSSEHCPQCGPNVHLLDFKFRPGSMAPFYPNNCTACINGCDDQLLNMLDIDHGSYASRSSLERSVSTVSLDNSNATSNDTGFGSSYISDSTQQTSSFHNRDTTRIRNTNNSLRSGSTWNTQQDTIPIRNTSNSWQSGSTSNIQQGGMSTRGSSRNTQSSGGLTRNTEQATDTNDVHCNCGLPAKRFTVMKETANKGRLFYCCSKQRDDSTKCDFFLWADAQPNMNNNSSNTFNANNPRGARDNNRSSTTTPNNFRARRVVQRSSTRKCGICKQVGHTRTNCPNNHS